MQSVLKGCVPEPLARSLTVLIHELEEQLPRGPRLELACQRTAGRRGGGLESVRFQSQLYTPYPRYLLRWVAISALSLLGLLGLLGMGWRWRGPGLPYGMVSYRVCPTVCTRQGRSSYGYGMDPCGHRQTNSYHASLSRTGRMRCTLHSPPCTTPYPTPKPYPMDGGAMDGRTALPTELHPLRPHQALLGVHWPPFYLDRQRVSCTCEGGGGGK